MNITSIKVTLELEGGEEVVAALSQLLSQCDGRVVTTEMPETSEPEKAEGERKQAVSGAELAADVIALAQVSAEVNRDIPPADKEARVQWSADRIKEIIAKHIRECENPDEMLAKCTQHHILWMYKALLGVPAAESSNSASGAMLALKMPDEDKSKILKLMDIMHRAKY